MKKIVLVLLVHFILVGCENTDDGTTSTLPELTTEGKDTFGCLIDGELFLPRKRVYGTPYNTPILKAVYVYNEYYFNGYRLAIYANNEITKKFISITLTGGQTALQEGMTYPIAVEEENAITGFYEHWGETIDNGDGTGFTPVYSFYTNAEYYGELELIKLDTVNQIISGRFWFDCEEVHDGSISEIREGRFDIKYTTDF
ncbi:MAG TPA: hypothetical protein P5188_11465 [Flavobacterium sp.]|jgi:hypothetical protein|nr:hypothetical protein [Flavobacterium sp.]